MHTHDESSLHPADGTVQTSINTYWSRYAATYDAFQVSQLSKSEIRAAWLDVWKAALPPPPARVLDIGTGSGNVAILLAEAGYDVIGVDLAEGMLDTARSKVRSWRDAPTFIVGDAVDPQFDHASFDAIVGRYVLWTLRQPQRALENWHALLKPVGRIALVDSSWFPNGVQSTSSGHATARRADFVNCYNEAVLAALPLAQSHTIDASVDVLHSGGFMPVEVTPLETILALDREYGVAEGHEAQLQFMLTATTLSRPPR